jgi:hypothetical protein
MTLELVPLATVTAELAAPFVLDGCPAGGRWVLEVDAVAVTGDDRYRRLNKIQAVAKGTLDGGTLTYEMYELR